MRVRALMPIVTAMTLMASTLAHSAEKAGDRFELKSLPKASGPKVSLFNGRDLDDWSGWLGLPDPAETYKPTTTAPIGPGGKGDMFKVVTEDGAPALYINGKTWGSLVHKGDYGNYHLRLEFKWGADRYAPRQDQPRNNGLLYHSHGAPGIVWRTWMRSMEFEIMTGSTGMIVPVGKGNAAIAAAVRDESLIDPKLRHSPGAPDMRTIGNTATWNIEARSDAEKPVGQWNVLDLYVLGDRAIHVVNGVPVMSAHGLCAPKTEDGPCLPLTHGAIQLQSEGAETYFRHITLEPITALPEIVRKTPQN